MKEEENRGKFPVERRGLREDENLLFRSEERRVGKE